MIDLITANLVSGFAEFTLIGIFMVLSPASIVLLLRQHRMVYGVSHNVVNERTPPWRKLVTKVWGLRRSPLIFANILFMLTIITHFGFSAERLVQATVNKDGDESVAFFLDLRERNQVARLILLAIAMLLGDVVITYRVWLVWGYNYWITVFPILMVAGAIVAESGMIRQFIVSHSTSGVFTAAVGPWITATCVTTICTHFYGTVVIAYRIWTSNRLLRNAGVMEGGRNLLDSMAIFVESAALWTFWVILYLIWYLTGSTLETICSGTCPAVIGITFMLITVRVGLGWGQETKTVMASMCCANATSGLVASLDRRRSGDIGQLQVISLTMRGRDDRNDGADVEQGLVVDISRKENTHGLIGV